MGLPRLLVLSLGGTITMTPGGQAGIVPTLSAADLVRSVPGLDRVAAIETASPMRLASGSLPIDGLIALAETIGERLAGDIDGAVVIQGTDTIEETAFLLDLLLRGDKPVVVTGAMRGPQAPGADGPANLLAAAIVAASPSAAGLGVTAVLNDQVHAARLVRKAHTSLPSAFASPLGGPIGLVSEGRLTIFLRPARSEPIALPADWRERPDSPVALLRMALGDDGRLAKALPDLGYRGLVVEGMGAGHVPEAVVPILGELATAMPVVLATRAHAGPVFTRTYGYPGSEIDLLGRGLIPGGTIGGLKARILLGLLMRAGLGGEELIAGFALRAGPGREGL